MCSLFSHAWVVSSSFCCYPDRAANGRGDPLHCEGDLVFSREPHAQSSCHPQVDALANKSLISEVTLLICEGLHSRAELLPRRFQAYPEDLICRRFQSERTEQIRKMQFRIRSLVERKQSATNSSYTINLKVGLCLNVSQIKSKSKVLLVVPNSHTHRWPWQRGERYILLPKYRKLLYNGAGPMRLGLTSAKVMERPICGGGKDLLTIQTVQTRLWRVVDMSWVSFSSLDCIYTMSICLTKPSINF